MSKLNLERYRDHGLGDGLSFFADMKYSRFFVVSPDLKLVTSTF